MKRESEREARELDLFPLLENKSKSFLREFLRTAVGEGIGVVKSNCHLLHCIVHTILKRLFIKYIYT